MLSEPIAPVTVFQKLSRDEMLVALAETKKGRRIFASAFTVCSGLCLAKSPVSEESQGLALLRIRSHGDFPALISAEDRHASCGF